MQEAEERIWSVPSGDPVAEKTTPNNGGARIYGDLTTGLDFKPRVKFSRLDPVFTIGSCFARNVEEALLGKGFNILTRGGSYPYPHGNLNRYNSPVMCQELEFAAGLRTFNEDGIVRIRGGFVDLTSYGAFTTRDEAVLHRQRSTALFAQLTHAKLAIITAGLSEIWFDRDFGVFCNISPSEAAKSFPERFEFRVMNFADNLAALEKLVQLIRSCSTDCKILLTVSPVPLGATFVSRDVLISNTYSKACLRAAVEELYWKYDFIDYFPSYEMVTLSDPAIVWESDRRHVRRQFVQKIMDEFVARFVVS